MTAPFFQQRRNLLKQTAVGFGHLAFSALVANGEASPASSSRHPLRARASHLQPRAKRVIFLFMKGGPSHVDTFDFKPQLQRDDGKELPFDKPRVQFAKTGKLLKSPWRFQRYGECGIQISELFPNVARHADELCFLHSVHGTNAAHGGALLKLHTGSDNFVRPSMGSWVVYGLGTENENLPGFITICPTLAHGGVKNWSSAFLPGAFQGTPLGNASRPATDARLKYATNEAISMDSQRLQLDWLRELNADHQRRVGPQQVLDTRMRSFELAFRMQSEAPGVEDISDETDATLRLYGLDEERTKDFGRQCLLARRFAERGVRFIQLTHSDSHVQWDQHSDLQKGHEKKRSRS